MRPTPGPQPPSSLVSGAGLCRPSFVPHPKMAKTWRTKPSTWNKELGACEPGRAVGVVAESRDHSEGPPKRAPIRKGVKSREKLGRNLAGWKWGRKAEARAVLPWQASVSRSHGNRSDALQLGCFLSLFLKVAPVYAGEHFSSPLSRGLPPAGPRGGLWGARQRREAQEGELPLCWESTI